MIDGIIEGVVVQECNKYTDERGWLIELFRGDQGRLPAMGYVSATLPGVARGPHEHKEQTDCFCFIGPSTFKLYLWDNRLDKPKIRQIEIVGQDRQAIVYVPPGVVHAYKNVGDVSGTVLNFPDVLYGGWGKKSPVDEIRHEKIKDSPFLIDM